MTARLVPRTLDAVDTACRASPCAGAAASPDLTAARALGQLNELAADCPLFVLSPPPFCLHSCLGPDVSGEGGHLGLALMGALMGNCVL
jgi:hypothetical protein